MKKFVLAITVLAFCSLSLAENASANHQSDAATGVRPATAPQFTVLHVFNGGPGDGSRPHAGVVRDAAGNLYGTTFTGGGLDEGTVYKLNTAGHVRVLFTFNNLNGSFPESGLILDKAGNLYGTAEEGPGGAGVLFRLDKNGNEEILHAFQGGFNNNPGVPAGGVIMDEVGNLYGATLAGGRGPFPGFGTLYQVDPSAKFTVLHDFQGKADGAQPQGPLVRDADGNFYGAALAGGKNNQGTIFKLATNGTLTVLHTFTGGTDGSGPQAGLLMDNARNLFGSATKGGDSGNGTVFEITKSGRFKRLYSFTDGSDGKNPNGELVQDADGNIYGTTQSGPGLDALGTVFKLDRAHTLAVLHSFKAGRDGASPLAGLMRDSAGNLYGTTIKNGLIRRVQGGSIFKITP
jgi:uncharacterized repeat protein (TIGR03803 family)